MIGVVGIRAKYFSVIGLGFMNTSLVTALLVQVFAKSHGLFAHSPHANFSTLLRLPSGGWREVL
jgi:hypothetical protein